MSEIEKKLKELQKQGYETVTINDVLRWINEFARERRLKRAEKKETGKH